MSDPPGGHGVLREGLQRALQTVAALGAAAILAMVIYTSFVVQNNRRAVQATATAVEQVRSTAAHATAVAHETAQVEQVNSWPPQTIVPPAGPLSVAEAGRIQELARWGESGPCALAWSPDGLYLAAQDSAGVHLYEALTWKEQAYLATPSSWCGLAFAPDGQTLAAVSAEAVRLWRWDEDTRAQTLGAFPGPVCGVGFALDGRLQVFGQADGHVATWLWGEDAGIRFYLPEEEGVWTYLPEEEGVWTYLFDGPADVAELSPLALSPDGALMAAASPDGALRMWRTADGLPQPAAGNLPLQAASGRPWRVWPGGGIAFGHLLFSPDSTLLVSLSDVAQVWRAADGALLQEFSGYPLGATFSPDSGSLLLATPDGTLEAWRVADGERLWTSPQVALPGPLALSTDGRLLAGAAPGIALAVFDVASWQLVALKQWDVTRWYAAAISLDGQYAATGAEQGVVWLWDVADGTPLHVLNAPADPQAPGWGVGALEFSPDGALLAAGTSSSTVSLWQVPAGRRVGTLSGPLPGKGTQVTAIAFSADGKLLAAGCAGETLLLWRVDNRTLVRVMDDFPAQMGAIVQVAFSPDGQALVSLAGPPGDLRLWRVRDGTFERTLETRSFAWAFILAADSTSIISAAPDRTIQRRLLADGRVVEELSTIGHPAMVHRAAISPDGALWAATGLDNTIWLWDLATGRPLRILRGHFGSVHGLAFSRDGRLLISASEDGTVRLWGVR